MSLVYRGSGETASRVMIIIGWSKCVTTMSRGILSNIVINHSESCSAGGIMTVSLWPANIGSNSGCEGLQSSRSRDLQMTFPELLQVESGLTSPFAYILYMTPLLSRPLLHHQLHPFASANQSLSSFVTVLHRSNDQTQPKCRKSKRCHSLKASQNLLLRKPTRFRAHFSSRLVLFLLSSLRTDELIIVKANIRASLTSTA